MDYAEPNHLWTAEDVFPSDPEFGELWGLHNIGQQIGYVPTGYGGPVGTADADIDAPDGWENATAPDGIVVAVIDTGIDVLCDDANYFSIDADAGDTVTATLTWEPGTEMTLQLLDADGTVLDEFTSTTGDESAS